MKFFDAFRIALHNLWQNKSRTILTIIIVLVVSALIMAMCLIGTNFISNNERMLKMMLDTDGSTYYISGTYDEGGSSHSDSYRNPTLAQAIAAREIAHEHRDAVDYAGYTLAAYGGRPGIRSVVIESDPFGNAVGNNPNDVVLLTDFAFAMPEPYIVGVTEGRGWNAADNESHNIWLSSDTMLGFGRQGLDYRIGDTLPLTFTEYEERYNERVLVSTETIGYTIAGIFDKTESENSWSRNPDAYIAAAPIEALYAGSEKEIIIGEITAGFYRAPDAYDYSKAVSAFKAYVGAVNKTIGPGYDWEGKATELFGNDFLDESEMLRLMGMLILGVLLILAFLILLLSIGSVANTIIISVDKNRKFIGLMKAMGLKNKGVKSIVYKEALVTIFLGVALAVCLVLCLGGPMETLLDFIFGSMAYGLEFSVRFTLSPWVPVGTAIAFFLMAILFSRGSLNRMGKADVITIISEVA